MNSCRSGSRAAATSKMERFVIIVNGWKPLTIVTKCSILVVAAALDPPRQELESCRWEIKYCNHQDVRASGRATSKGVILKDSEAWIYRSVGVLVKTCSENIQQIYGRTPMPKFDFIKLLCNFISDVSRPFWRLVYRFGHPTLVPKKRFFKFSFFSCTSTDIHWTAISDFTINLTISKLFRRQKFKQKRRKMRQKDVKAKKQNDCF